MTDRAMIASAFSYQSSGAERSVQEGPQTHQERDEEARKKKQARAYCRHGQERLESRGALRDQ